MNANKKLGEGYYLTKGGEIIYKDEKYIYTILSAQQVEAVKLLIKELP